MSESSVRSLVDQCQFYVCYLCSFTICKRFFLLPSEIKDNICPNCKAEGWYKEPTFVNAEECYCCVHSCASCEGTLCSCTIESIGGLCPWCKLHVRWVVAPPGAKRRKRT